MKSLLHFHKSRQAEATILLNSGTKGIDYGNVELGEDHKILSFYEKPKHSEGQLVNAGVYCLEYELILKQPEGTASIEQDWFPQWLCRNRVLGVVLSKPIFDIGTRERFELAKQKLGQMKLLKSHWRQQPDLNKGQSIHR